MMSFSMEVLQWHVFIVFLSLTAAWPDHHIKISSQGHDNTTCLTNSSFPCKTLDYVFNNLLTNSTLLEITEGTYNLDNVYNIKGKRDILIVGEPDKVVINCNASRNATAGLSWLQSENITLRFLIFEECGHLIHTSPLEHQDDTIYTFCTGLSFVYCRNLGFYNCTFKNSRGLAVTAYDSGGKVSFIGSNFLYNGAANNTDMLNSSIQRSGGGVMIHLTKYGYYYPFNDTIHQRYSDNNRFYFKETLFQNNSYHKSSSKEVPSPFGWGGGLTVIVGGTAKNNIFSIDSSQFEGNEAIWGGGVFAEFHDLAGGNSISLSDNHFLMNFARYAGGGLRLGNNIIERNSSMTVNENQIELLRNHFYINKATLGGGLSYYGWTYHDQKTDHSYRKIVMKECTFDGNVATVGSSIALNLNDGNNWLTNKSTQRSCVVHLVDCAFNNSVALPATLNDVHNVTGMGMGAVYTSRVPLVLQGNNAFTNNDNTALLLDNAPLKVVNKTLFESNKGYFGGALAFYGQTKLVMTKNSRLVFRNNEAKQKGGAIYIRTPGPDIAPFKTTMLRRYACILQYEDDDSNIIELKNISIWQTKLEFFNNKAPLFYGNSIYATTLQSCYRQGETSTHNEAFQWQSITDFNGTIDEEISTDPVSIDFNADDWLKLAPYEKFNAFVHLRDEKNSTVSGIARIDVHSTHMDHNLKLEPESSLFLIQATKTGSVVPGLRIKGKENQNFTLKISTFGGQVIEVSMQSMLGQCREGFEQSSKAHPYMCTCMKDSEDYHEGIYNCSDDGKSVNLKMGYWGGLAPNGSRKVFVTYPCPEHYCFFDSKKTFFTYNNKNICSSDRTSYLCGKCKDNYTLSLGNEKCQRDVTCEKHVYLITWTLPVFFVVVPIVVLVLLRLNFDIFTPYLASWLYFYQMLPYVVQKIERFDPGMQVVLTLASWRLPGAHFGCFVKGLDNIGKLFFNYLFPLYVLFIVIAVAKITRWCGCRCFGRSNIFNAISTIVVFSYTDLTIISFSVFRWVSFGRYLSVLYVQGSVTTTTLQDHRAYYLLLTLAILVVLFFVVALPFTLLFKPFLVKRIRFIANFNNLFSIFQGCYRDERIYFSAYYFILRVVILFFYSIVLTAPGPLKQFWIDFILVLSLVVFVYGKPYKTDDYSNVRWLNIVDTSILTLLCLMSRMSATLYSQASKTTVTDLSNAIKVLAWFPMIYLLILVVLAIKNCSAAARRQHEYQNIEEVSTGGTDDGGGTRDTSLTRSSNPLDPPD